MAIFSYNLHEPQYNLHEPGCSVIYWINQSRADASKLFCVWLTILRPAWRQVAVLQCKQLNMCTQSVKLNIGPGKVCAQVSTQNVETHSFVLGSKTSEKEVPLFDNFHVTLLFDNF